jgi:hypothetical protein
VTDRFHIGRALVGALTGLLPIRQGLRYQASLGVVVKSPYPCKPG